jgi:hypothetical protein
MKASRYKAGLQENSYLDVITQQTINIAPVPSSNEIFNEHLDRDKFDKKKKKKAENHFFSFSGT